MENIRRFLLDRGLRGYGFSIKEGAHFDGTVVVAWVEQNGPADHAGIRVGQRIQAINGRPVKAMDFYQAFNEIHSSSKCLLLDVIDSTVQNQSYRQSHLNGGRRSLTQRSRIERIPGNSTVILQDSQQTAVTINSELGQLKHLTSPHSPSTSVSKLPTSSAAELYCLSPIRNITQFEPISPLDTAADISPRPSYVCTTPITSVSVISTSVVSESLANPDYLSNNGSHIPSVQTNSEVNQWSLLDKVTHNCEENREDDWDISDDNITHHFISGRHGMPSPLAPSDTDSPINVKFVRKRAYASARQVRTSDRIPDASSPPSGFQCQLRFASSQPVSPVNACNTEPIITHLPRRRSTRTHVDGRPNPNNIMRLAAFADSDHSADILPVSKPYSPQPTAVNCLLTESEANSNSPQSPAHILRSGYTLSGSIETGSERTIPDKPKETPNLLDSILHTSFDKSSDDLWLRAGDAYRSLDLADKIMTEKLAKKRSQTSVRNDLTESIGGLDIGPNKENDSSGGLGGCQSSFAHTRYSSQSPWFQPCSAADSPLTSGKNSVAHRTLGSGLPTSRSTMNECSGGFLSPQCLCKILTLDGKVYKHYPWRIYQMSIIGNEVQFLKTSGFRSACRSIKPAKHSKGVLNLTLDSPSMNSVNSLDSSSLGTESDNTTTQRTEEFYPVLSSSRLVLPIPYLTWYLDQLTPDFPSWASVIKSKSGTVNAAPKSQFPALDLMNPVLSGISNMCTDSVDQRGTSGREGQQDTLSSFRCYRFSHVQTRTEFLFVFPEEEVASTCLKLLEMAGGKQVSLSFTALNDLSGERQTPRIETSDRYALSAKRYASPNQDVLHLTRHGRTHVTESPHGHPVTSSASRPRLEERRQRLSATRLASGDSKVISNTNTRKGSSNHVESVNVALRGTPESKTPSSARGPSKNQFLQGIKQLLQRPTLSSSSGLGSNSQPKSSELSRRLAAILGDPPDFSEIEIPGPIFGALLENQLESPDYPYVPAILHAFVVALELHGLSHPGLYRKPGRQRSVSQFICASNLVPRDMDVLLKLDAWNEPYALCGLLKHFLRRLPVRLLDLVSWIPVASLVPDKRTEIDLSHLAYLLLSVRVKLWKLVAQAADRSGTSSAQNETFRTSSSLPRLRRISSIPRISPLKSDESPTSAKWHWHTLEFVVNHLRRVVSFVHHNEVSYKCAAICFGPVLFDDTLLVDKLNTLSECLLEHWPWLTQGFPTSDELLDASISRPTMYELTLADAINYLEHRTQNPDGLVSLDKHSTEVNVGENSISSTGLKIVNSSATPCLNQTPSATADIDDIRKTVKHLMMRAFAKSDGDVDGSKSQDLVSDGPKSGTPKFAGSANSLENVCTNQSSLNSPSSDLLSESSQVNELSSVGDVVCQPSVSRLLLKHRMSVSAPTIRRPVVPPVQKRLVHDL